MEDLYESPFQMEKYYSLVKTVKEDILSHKPDIPKYKSVLHDLYGEMSLSKERYLMILLGEDAIDAFSQDIHSAFALSWAEEGDST